MITNKTLYGILAFGPIGLILLSFLMFLGSYATLDFNNRLGGPTYESSRFLAGFIGLMLIAFLLSIVSFFLYIIHISKNKQVPDNQRALWIVGMILANGITNIIYFFVYIKREKIWRAQQEAQQENKGPWS